MMTQRHALQAYREKVRVLNALRQQMEALPRDAADADEANMQLADALETMMKARRRELDQLWPRVLATTSQIDDGRLYFIIHAYFVRGLSAEEIAEQLFISRRTVSRLKKGYLDGLAG